MKILELARPRTPGTYIYHATRLPKLKEGLISIQKQGLMPGKNAMAGPGVYMGYEPNECLCRISCKEARVLESRWQSLRVLYGADPSNPVGLPASFKITNLAEGLRKIQKLGLGTVRSSLKDENFYNAAETEPHMLRASWTNLVEYYGVHPKEPNGIRTDSLDIILPRTLTANMLEIELKPKGWVSIDSAIEILSKQ